MTDAQFGQLQGSITALEVAVRTMLKHSSQSEQLVAAVSQELERWQDVAAYRSISNESFAGYQRTLDVLLHGTPGPSQ